MKILYILLSTNGGYSLMSQLPSFFLYLFSFIEVRDIAFFVNNFDFRAHLSLTPKQPINQHIF